MATVLEKRVVKTLDQIRLIGNRATDVTTPEDADAVEAAIVDALNDAMTRLRKVRAARKAPEFHLPSQS